MTYLILAEGLAAIEAVGAFDILRRGDVDCRTVAVGDDRAVQSAQGLGLTADFTMKDLPEALPEMLILPGGLGGVEQMMASDALRRLAVHMMEQDRPVGAICAAPMALGKWGLLKKRRVTCHPTVADRVAQYGGVVTGDQWQQDGNLITGNGPGASIVFGLSLLQLLRGSETADKVAAQLSIIR